MFIDDLATYANDQECTDELIHDLMLSTRFQIKKGISSLEDVLKQFDGFDQGSLRIKPASHSMWFEIEEFSDNNHVKGVGSLLTIDKVGKEGYLNCFENAPKDTHWLIRAETFISTHLNGDRKFHPSERLSYLAVAEDGRWLASFNFHNVRVSRWKTFIPDGDTIQDDEISPILVVPTFALHCFQSDNQHKIVKYHPTRQVRRNAERKGEIVHPYCVIDMELAGRLLSEKADLGQEKLTASVRGNFAHYTADKPLFGKYVGTIYRPKHERGMPESNDFRKKLRVP